MGKHAFRLVPFETYEVENLESWLSALSERGLYPVRVYRTPLLVKCEKGAPGDCRVRLEPADREEPEPPDALSELYEAAGWEYIGTFSGQFYAFRTCDRQAAEPHSDSVLYEQVIRRSMRRAIRDGLISTLIICAAVGFVFFVTLADQTPMISLLNNGLWKMLYLAVLVILWSLVETRQLCSVFSFRRRLKKGDPPRRDRHFAAWRLTLHRAATCLLLLFSIGWYILLFASIGFTDSHTIAQDEALPFPQVYTLSPEAEPGGFRIDGTDYQNYVAVTRDLIVPRHYKLRQQDTDASILLEVDCYISRLPALSVPLARELAPPIMADAELLWSDGEFYIRYCTTPAVYEPGDDQLLILCTPQRAALIRYRGEADLRDYARAFAGLDEDMRSDKNT